VSADRSSSTPTKRKIGPADELEVDVGEHDGDGGPA
jgi:hypothetical protein